MGAIALSSGQQESKNIDQSYIWRSLVQALEFVVNRHL
jgi:hypothetical protein